MYGLLPLNIRLDDIFVVVVFVSALIKNPGFRYLSRFWTVKLALAWWLICFVGSINGLFYTGGQSSVDVLKFLLKAAYIPLTVAAIILSVQKREDFSFIITSMVVAGACAALLGIGTVFSPDDFTAFLIPTTSMQTSVIDDLDNSMLLERRAAGAIGIVSMSILCPLVSLLSFSLLRSVNQMFWKRCLYFITGVVALLGLIYTQSRAPLMGFLLGFVVVLFSSRRHFFLKGAFIVIATVAVLSNDSIRRVVFNRFEGTTGSTLNSGIEKRSRIWKELTVKFEPELVVNGVGFIPCQRIYGFDAHNTYLGAIIYGGLWGVIFLVAIIYFYLKMFRSLLFGPLSTHNIWAYFVLATLIFLLIIGISIEAFQETFCMHLCFTFLAIGELLKTKAFYTEHKNKY
jgi:hypothetical protein